MKKESETTEKHRASADEDSSHYVLISNLKSPGFSSGPQQATLNDT